MFNRLVTTRTDRFFWRTTTAIMLGDLFIGLGFILGAPANSPSYSVAFQLMPPMAWGMVATLAAILYLVGMHGRQRTLILAGLTLGGFYVNVFALTFIFGAFTGSLAGFTAIIFWGVGGLLHIFAAAALPTSKQIVRLEDHRA